jgi:hypothetical protein
MICRRTKLQDCESTEYEQNHFQVAGTPEFYPAVFGKPERRQSCQNPFGIHFFHLDVYFLVDFFRQALNRLITFPIPIFISFLIFFSKLNIISQKGFKCFLSLAKC